MVVGEGRAKLEELAGGDCHTRSTLQCCGVWVVCEWLLCIPYITVAMWLSGEIQGLTPPGKADVRKNKCWNQTSLSVKVKGQRCQKQFEDL